MRLSRYRRGVTFLTPPRRAFRPGPIALRRRVALECEGLTILQGQCNAHARRLEVDYRMEHCNTDAIRGLVSLIYSDAEEHYGKLFRIVSGDDVLEALDDPSLSLAS